MVRRITLLVLAGLFIFALNNLSFAMVCAGTGNGLSQIAQAHSEHEHGTTEATEATKDTATKESVNVGNKICPVSGEKIDEKMKVTYEYEGKVYNFCCSMCIDEFKNNPEKYIKKVEEELQSEAKEGAGHQGQGMEMMQESTTTHQGMHQGHHH